MAYDQQLADRMRSFLSDLPGYSERKMFGGICFMINGNMAAGTVHDFAMIRVGADAYEAALAEGARELEFVGRPMTGMVEVAADHLTSEDDLHGWLQRGIDCAGALPPKAPKAGPAR